MFDLLGIVRAAVLNGTPLLFGTSGEILTQKSGNMNLGVEGLMFMGGAFGLAGAFAYSTIAGDAASGLVAILVAIVCAFAAGFLGSQKYVTDAFGVAVNGRTNVDTKPGQYETSVPGVFAAGDMHRGQSLVVWAIREGREAAKAVDLSLMGYTNL